jgi:FkbM family methyltransferase
MIVKDEAHIIASTLENLCHYIEFDYWVIVDTGSTDNTKQIISDFFKDRNIKGELHETEWKNFGFNRSDALSKAFKKTDYLLIFDADDRIVGEFVLPKELNLDGYHLKFGDNFSYVRLLLVNNALRWKFMGVLHEYIICTNENYTCKYENIEGNYHLISGKSGARSNNPNKYRDDALILETAYDEAKKNKDDIMVRYSFYCAQSYKDAGNHKKSIEWYKKRIGHGGWNQEVYYSYITIGQLYAKMNNIESAFYYWALSFNADPERCEGIYYIINRCRENGNFKLAFHYYKWVENNKTRNLINKLFVTEDIYKYLLDYEFTIIACYVNQHKLAIPSFHALFKYANALSSLLKENIVYNLQFYINFIDCITENLPFFYDYIAFVKQIYLETGSLKKHIVDITDTLVENFTPVLTHYNSYRIISLANSCKEIIDTVSGTVNELDVTVRHDVILTITSCKRFDLFQKTVNSFINNCSDVNKITYFFCVDDNSSDEDREKMMKMYPFFDFYFKNPSEKGHRQSMNIIWNKLNKLKPSFYLHLEDDWLFINKRSYLTDSVSFLERYESDGIHQILFNKNYAEVIRHYNTVGGKIIDKDNNIKLHIKDEPNLNGLNCAYWPHFSFRPSVIRTSAILALGNFDSPNTFFERDYADKYFHFAGYMSAYFNDVSSIHIGKLTFETQDDKKNAYHLNSEQQFNSGNANATEHVNGNTNNKIKVVNLLRRTDRRDGAVKNFKNANITNYEFIEAVDGKALTTSSELISLFKGNDFGNRRGVIGCALTHYNLWKKLLESDFEFFFIMEDDFTVVESFKGHIERINFEKYDILLMGYSMFSKTLEKVKQVYRRSCHKGEEDLLIDKLQMDYFIGGTFCYSINKNGAKKLVDYINKNGIKHGIDYLFKIVPELECFETRPHISFSEWNEGGKAVDSDIQNMYESIDLSDTPDGLLEKYHYYPNEDFFGSDIHYIGNKSLFDQLLIAEGDSSCVCFNTLGYFKHEFDATKLIKINCGLYVKKQYISSLQHIITQPSNKNKIRVKMLCNWCSSEQLCREWSNMCLDGFSWKNIEITWDSENIDYYVIINQTNETGYDKSRTIIFQMEPWVYDDGKNWGVKTWGEWSKPDSSLFFHVHNHVNYLNNVQWLLKQPLSVVSKDFTEKNINKFDNILTCVCSKKNNDVGHQLRNNFIRYIEENSHTHTHSITLQVFGKSNFYNFTSYVGELLDDDKYHSLIQYKYHISCENNFEYNYATEKIWEPILCECLCFYHGCPNLEDYIDSNAFVRIDLNDFESSLQIVKKAMQEDWWSQRLPFIRAEKQKILTKLGFFPTLKNIIESKSKQENGLQNSNICNVIKDDAIYYSQDKQDYFLENSVFKGYKSGIYVDVGAHDGVTINNTLYFHKNNKWNGINIEPIKSVYDKLLINRPNDKNINCAICNYDGKTEFICNNGYTEMISGIKETYDKRHYDRLDNENKIMNASSEIIIVDTKKLETIFDENKISHIHYLSIDVEGGEFEVIKSINFDKVFIDVIGFENNYNDVSVPIIEYLQSKKYVVINKSVDIFMIHERSMFYSNLNIRLQEFRNSNISYNSNSNKNKKKIAICLFGQPRDYVIGHKNIKDLIENQEQYDCDIFFHCWNIENHSVYKSAEWREIPKKSLIIEDMDVVNQQLLELYKPVKYKFENSIDKFNENIYNDTIAYKNITNDKILQNINNILSQMYSRNEVRKLFEQHISETNIEYDYVIMTRFDVMKKINLKLELLEGNKVYIDNMHYPRKIITDTFIICPQHIFIRWFNLFDNLKNILNNEEINKKMKQNNEKLIVNAEELIMANFIYYFDINLVNYLPNINVYNN